MTSTKREFIRWLTGKSLFEKAEADPGKPPDGYRRAASALSLALDAPDAGHNPRLAAECPYDSLAWCRYRLDDDATAADEFGEAAVALEEHEIFHSPPTPSGWRPSPSRRFATRDPRADGPGDRGVRDLRADYPDHPKAPQAGYQVLRLDQETLPSSHSPRPTRSIPGVPRRRPESVPRLECGPR